MFLKSSSFDFLLLICLVGSEILLANNLSVFPFTAIAILFSNEPSYLSFAINDLRYAEFIDPLLGGLAGF